MVHSVELHLSSLDTLVTLVVLGSNNIMGIHTTLVNLANLNVLVLTLLEWAGSDLG